MAQQTMTEKDSYLANFEREYQTTLKVLRAFPPDQFDFKPTEKNRPARDIIWILTLNQMVIVPTLEMSELKPGGLPAAPKTFTEMLGAFEDAHRSSVAKVKAANDRTLNEMMRMPVGPKQLGDVRRIDALWMFLHDTIHHRGQLSVYVRGCGGKLPSIYGPTADEPWT